MRNFERLDELFSLIKVMMHTIDDILEWKNPFLTFIIWLIASIACFWIPISHLPFFLCGFILIILGFTLISFLKGETHKKWIHRVPGNVKSKLFRPVATIRFVPLGATQLEMQEKKN